MNKQYAIYFTYVVNMLRGGDPVATDNFLNEHMDTILEVAEELYGDIPQKKIYRGIILSEKTSSLNPHPNFTYISCTESLKIAESFADPTPSGFGSFFNLGEHGYIAKISPPYQVLYHHSILKDKRFREMFINFFGSGKDGIGFFEKQKEVTIVQPEKPIKLTPYLSIKGNPNNEISDDVLRELPFDDFNMMGKIFYKIQNKVDQAYTTMINDSNAGIVTDVKKLIYLHNNITTSILIFAPYVVHYRRQGSAFFNGFYSIMSKFYYDSKWWSPQEARADGRNFMFYSMLKMIAINDNTIRLIRHLLGPKSRIKDLAYYARTAVWIGQDLDNLEKLKLAEKKSFIIESHESLLEWADEFDLQKMLERAEMGDAIVVNRRKRKVSKKSSKKKTRKKL